MITLKIVFNYIIIITITNYDNPRSDGKMGSYEIWTIKATKGAKIRNRYNQVPQKTLLG